VEVSSAAWAPCSRSSSRTTSSWYSSHPLSVCRASTMVSRASYWSWYQSRSELSQSRRSYLSCARPSSSCHRRTRCGRKQSQETRECGRGKGINSKFNKKYVPGKSSTRDPCGSVALVSALLSEAL
jgi:hypothetical protein